MASITDVRKKMTILSHRETRFDDISISRARDGEIVDAVDGFANITVRSRC